MERDTWHVQTFVLPIAPAEEGLRLLHAEYADSNGILALLFIVVEEHNEIILYTVQICSQPRYDHVIFLQVLGHSLLPSLHNELPWNG